MPNTEVAQTPGRRRVGWGVMLAMLLLVVALTAMNIAAMHQVDYRVQGVLQFPNGQSAGSAEVLLLLEDPARMAPGELERRFAMQRMRWQNDPAITPDFTKLSSKLVSGIVGAGGYFIAEVSGRYETHSNGWTYLFENPHNPFRHAWLIVWRHGKILAPISLDAKSWSALPAVVDLGRVDLKEEQG